MSNFISVGFGATSDLRTHQYKAVTIGGTIAGTNTVALGLLQNKPNTNEDASIVSIGVSRYKSGAAVNSGATLMVNSDGFMVTVTSGSLGCGQAFEGISSGSIGEGVFNFAGAKASVAV